MESRVLRKSKGSRRVDPDSKRDWKVFHVFWDHTHRKREKKRTKAKHRRYLAKEAADHQGKLTRRNRPIEYGYTRQGYAYGTNRLERHRIRRTGRYCSECDTLLCRRRALQIPVIIMVSQKNADGAFGTLPRDIALKIAVLATQMQFDYLDTLVQRHIEDIFSYTKHYSIIIRAYGPTH